MTEITIAIIATYVLGYSITLKIARGYDEAEGIAFYWPVFAFVVIPAAVIYGFGRGVRNWMKK